MSRPEFLNCVMTPEVIRGIRQEQECYDRDPEAYEQRQQEERERHEMEQEEMRQQERRDYEGYLENLQADEDPLPF